MPRHLTNHPNDWPLLSKADISGPTGARRIIPTFIFYMFLTFFIIIISAIIIYQLTGIDSIDRTLTMIAQVNPSALSSPLEDNSRTTFDNVAQKNGSLPEDDVGSKSRFRRNGRRAAVRFHKMRIEADKRLRKMQREHTHLMDDMVVVQTKLPQVLKLSVLDAEQRVSKNGLELETSEERRMKVIEEESSNAKTEVESDGLLLMKKVELEHNYAKKKEEMSADERTVYALHNELQILKDTFELKVEKKMQILDVQERFWMNILNNERQTKLQNLNSEYAKAKLAMQVAHQGMVWSPTSPDVFDSFDDVQVWVMTQRMGRLEMLKKENVFLRSWKEKYNNFEDEMILKECRIMRPIEEERKLLTKEIVKKNEELMMKSQLEMERDYDEGKCTLSDMMKDSSRHYYVYAYVDASCLPKGRPPTSEEFLQSIVYLGKGSGSRFKQHMIEAKRLWDGKESASYLQNLYKTDQILTIVERKGNILVLILKHLGEKEAFLREGLLINAMILPNRITNKEVGSLPYEHAKFSPSLLEKIKQDTFMRLLRSYNDGIYEEFKPWSDDSDSMAVANKKKKVDENEHHSLPIDCSRRNSEKKMTWHTGVRGLSARNNPGYEDLQSETLKKILSKLLVNN